MEVERCDYVTSKDLTIYYAIKSICSTAEMIMNLMKCNYVTFYKVFLYLEHHFRCS